MCSSDLFPSHDRSGQSLQCFDHIEEVSATVPDYCFTEYHELYVSESSPVIVQCTIFYHRFEKNGTCEGGLPIPPDEFSDWFLIAAVAATPPIVTDEMVRPVVLARDAKATTITRSDAADPKDALENVYVV